LGRNPLAFQPIKTPFLWGFLNYTDIYTPFLYTGECIDKRREM
jgi:hypothetical protein